MSETAWLLDTNIVSELMRPAPNANVRAQIARFEAEIAVPAPVWHELRYGWLRMESGRRRDAIGHFLQDVVASLPILPYDSVAARLHAEFRHARERLGRPLPFVDGQIGAIAVAHGLTLVTRNTGDFESLSGLRIENWFDDPTS